MGNFPAKVITGKVDGRILSHGPYALDSRNITHHARLPYLLETPASDSDAPQPHRTSPHEFLRLGFPASRHQIAQDTWSQSRWAVDVQPTIIDLIVHWLWYNQCDNGLYRDNMSGEGLARCNDSCPGRQLYRVCFVRGQHSSSPGIKVVKSPISLCSTHPYW